MARLSRVYRSADEAFVAVLDSVMQDGYAVAPRGKKTLELVGASFTLGDARRNIVTAPARKLNYYFSVAEWMWILLGRRDVKTIAYFNKNIAAFSDDGRSFFGAYGPWVVAQMPYVVQALRNDPNTRQAIMTIWQQSPPPTKDVPCTIALQFLLRRGRLHCVATMRSNDAWLGLPYDLFNFTQIQAYVAAAVGAPVGTYTHQAASLHLYEENFDAAMSLVSDSPTPGSTVYVDAPQSPELTLLPLGTGLPDVARMFEALADSAEAPGVPVGYAPAPWDGYLGLLKYKTTKDPALLKAPYADIIARRLDGAARAA